MGDRGGFAFCGIKLVVHVLNKLSFMETNMTTLSTVLNKLKCRGHDNEFVMNEKGFGIAGKGKYYQPAELMIIRTYRFEGNSDPSDSSILYLIEANDGLIGYTIDAYGAYSNNDGPGYDDFIKKLHIENRDEQLIF